MGYKFVLWNQNEFFVLLVSFENFNPTFRSRLKTSELENIVKVVGNFFHF